MTRKLRFKDLAEGDLFHFVSERGVWSTPARGRLAWQGARGPWVKVSATRYMSYASGGKGGRSAQHQVGLSTVKVVPTGRSVSRLWLEGPQPHDEPYGRDPSRKKILRKTKAPLHGIHIQWSPVNAAYFVMWHGSVLRILSTKKEAEAYARSLYGKTANDPGRKKRGKHASARISEVQRRNRRRRALVHRADQAHKIQMQELRYRVRNARDPGKRRGKHARARISKVQRRNLRRSHRYVKDFMIADSKIFPHDMAQRIAKNSHVLNAKRRRGTRDPQRTRDYEYVVYPSTRVEGQGVRIPGTGFKAAHLAEAKRVAKQHWGERWGAGIYSVSKGRFVGWINRSGRYAPFR